MDVGEDDKNKIKGREIILEVFVVVYIKEGEVGVILGEKVWRRVLI